MEHVDIISFLATGLEHEQARFAIECDPRCANLSQLFDVLCPDWDSSPHSSVYLSQIWDLFEIQVNSASGLQSAVQLSSIKRNIHINITAASHGQLVSNILDLSCKLRNNLFQISHLKIISEDFQSGRSSDYQARLL